MGKSIRNFAAVTRVGLDLAKKVFQVHAIDAKSEIVVVRKLARGRLVAFFAELPPCVVAMEACSSAHNWGRALIDLGHEVKLIPPAHVKPYVRRNKNDAADAAGHWHYGITVTLAYLPYSCHRATRPSNLRSRRWRGSGGSPFLVLLVCAAPHR